MLSSCLDTLQGLIGPIFTQEPSLQQKVAVAVSGGLDSLFLLRLVHIWAKKQEEQKGQCVEVIVLTVDHRLRRDSEKEALDVGDYCAELGVNHHILSWEHDLIQTGIQEKARQARYDLMYGFCKENQIPILLTAHHGDDNIETFLMRLKRGSGVVGLSAIKPLSRVEIGYLVRPLLGFFKDDIKKTYEAHFYEVWIEDPSNRNICFERVTLRSQLEFLEKMGFSKKALLSSINHLQRTRDFIEKSVRTAIEECYAPPLIDRSYLLKGGGFLGAHILQSIAFEMTKVQNSISLFENLYQKIEHPSFKAATASNLVFSYRTQNTILIEHERRQLF